MAQGRNQYTKTRDQMLKMGLMSMTEEQKMEARRKGGQASAARYRRMKHMQEIARAVLSLRLRGEDEIREALREGGFADEDINYAAGIIMSQTFKAIGGDTRAAEFVRDTVLPAMAALRAVCDEAETLTAADYWPFPTYGDLLFGV